MRWVVTVTRSETVDQTQRKRRKTGEGEELWQPVHAAEPTGVRLLLHDKSEGANAIVCGTLTSPSPSFHVNADVGGVDLAPAPEYCVAAVCRNVMPLTGNARVAIKQLLGRARFRRGRLPRDRECSPLGCSC